MRFLLLALAACFSKPPRPGASEVRLRQVVTLHYNMPQGSVVEQSSMLPVNSADDLVIAVIAAESGGVTGLSFDDSTGGTWGIASIANCNQTQLALGYAMQLPVADVMVTARTTSTSSYLGVALYEYSGIASFDIASFACAPPAPTSPIDFSPVTLSRTGLVFAAYADTSAFQALITPNPPMVLEDSNASFIYTAADDVGSAGSGVPPGPYSAGAFDQHSSTNWAGIVAAFVARE